MLRASRVAVLWCGVEAARVADAMIAAQFSTKGMIDNGDRVSGSSRAKTQRGGVTKAPCRGNGRALLPCPPALHHLTRDLGYDSAKDRAMALTRGGRTHGSIEW